MVTVPSKVQISKIIRNLGQIFQVFSKLADWNGDFGPLLNQVFNILVQNQSLALWKLNFEAKIYSNFFKAL